MDVDSNPDDGILPDGPEATEVVCEIISPPASGTCEVTAGGEAKLLKGTVLTPDKVYIGGQVALDAEGRISCVGCDCEEAGQTVVTCAEGVISPGLINPHDHITFTQNQPYNDIGVRYEHRHQWRVGQDGRPRIPSQGSATADQIRWGELRFLMGGATSIVGSGGQAGFLRNLDRANLQEGLGQGAVNFDTFPLNDSSGTRRAGDCNYGGTPTTAASIAGDDSYEPHTSEGIDDTARNEFLCQSSTEFDTMAPGTSNNLLLPKTAMIHAVGLKPADLDAMAQASSSLIWSPRSNITLYGDTARVTTARALGVNISLGTDWMPTGSMNMLRELRCADDLNRNYYNNTFSDREMWQMVTTNAAVATKTDEVIGLLAPGKVGDIAIFKANGKTFRAVIEAEPEDVMLVLRGGRALYGEATAVDALADNCDAVDVCTSPKRVCAMSEVGKTYEALKTGAGSSYPAFQCDEPMNEPSCHPERPESIDGSTIYTGETSATDSDGDGVPNATDKCPMVFDPARPLDMGMQGDADGDGVGDACDVCPLDANSSTCTPSNPNDRDGDGVENSADNCPDLANGDQADMDADGKGDACDACPMAANPGAQGCPASIYSIKTGATPVGTAVRVTNALVTGKGSNGFFVQAKLGDAGYMGADNSGLFVFTSNAAHLAAATVGARVSIEGTVENFQGQIELASIAAVTVDAAGPEALPDPVPTTYAEVKTGGARAAALEGVLVSLGAATVSAVQPMFGEFTLTSGADNLVVDDFLFVPTPAPQIGQAYSATRGIVSLRSAGGGVSAMKLLPRSAADLVAGAPSLASLTPAVSFTKVGTVNAPTFPTPLRVNLTGPAQGATVVTLTSMSPTTLTVMNVTVPDGATGIDVPVSGLVMGTTVITGQIGAGMVQMAMVRVLGAAEVPTTVTLSPAEAGVPASGSVTLTATLDIPAPTGGTVVTLATTAGTVPATVTVLENQTTATFSFTDTVGSGTATVTATLGASTSTATITVSTGAQHLVINEVEYDQPSTDETEYVEIYNPTGAAVSLAGKQLLLVNGADETVYDTIDLSPAGSLPAGGYLVVAGAGVSVTAPAIKVMTGWTSNAMQNGPDAIALIDNTAHTLIDAFSYEGAVNNVDLPGFSAPVNLNEGTPPSTVADGAMASQGVCRSPNGTDTDLVNADWKVCPASVGTANPVVP